MVPNQKWLNIMEHKQCGLLNLCEPSLRAVNERALCLQQQMTDTSKISLLLLIPRTPAVQAEKEWNRKTRHTRELFDRTGYQRLPYKNTNEMKWWVDLSWLFFFYGSQSVVWVPNMVLGLYLVVLRISLQFEFLVGRIHLTWSRLDNIDLD